MPWVLVNPSGRETPPGVSTNPDKTTAPYTRAPRRRDSSSDSPTTHRTHQDHRDNCQPAWFSRNPQTVSGFWGRDPQKDFPQASPRVRFHAIQSAPGPLSTSAPLPVERPANGSVPWTFVQRMDHAWLYGGRSAGISSHVTRGF